MSCLPFARSGFRASTCAAALRALSLSFSLNLLLLVLPASGFCCLATAGLLLRRCVFPFFSSCWAQPPCLLQQVGKSCTTFIVNKRQRNIIAQVWLYYSMIGNRAHGFSLAKFYIWSYWSSCCEWIERIEYIHAFPRMHSNFQLGFSGLWVVWCWMQLIGLRPIYVEVCRIVHAGSPWQQELFKLLVGPSLCRFKKITGTNY